MAKKNGVTQVEKFLKDQLVDVQKRFAQLENDAQRVLEDVVERSKDTRKELEALVRRIDLGDVQKKVGLVQRKVVESVGVASQGQVEQLNRELARLVKKVDALVGKKADRSSPQN
jgi:hypothetical protein